MAKTAHPEAQLEMYQGTKHERLKQLFLDWSGCTACPLGKYRELENEAVSKEAHEHGREAPAKYDIVFGEGNPDAHILIVGEAPGEEEMKYQIPFIGKSGQLLNQLMAGTSADQAIKAAYHDYNRGRRTVATTDAFHSTVTEWRHTEFFVTNAVSCRPPENRQPSPQEIKECWHRLWNIIYIVDPMLIIACGNSAMSAVSRRVSAKITKERGSIYDATYTGRIGKLTYPVIPIFHPSYLLRKADWKVRGGDWEKTVNDWKKAIRVVDSMVEQHYGVPPPDREPYG